MMSNKKLTDEQIQWDVEKINGYLCAVEAMNIAANIDVDYAFARLPEKHTLRESVESKIAATYPDTVLANWHITLEPVPENQLRESIQKWFFRFGNAAQLSESLRSLPAGFMDILKPLLYTPAIYRIAMIPPLWYAIDWALFVFDTKNGLFLLEFNVDA